MSISIPGVPSNVRVPFTYFGVDNSKAGFQQASTRVLVFGQALTSGTAPLDVAVQVFNNQADLFGIGSMLSRQVDTVYLNAPTAEVWAIPLADEGAESKWNVTIGGGGLDSAQVVSIMIGGRIYRVTALSGASNAEIAASLTSEIADDLNSHVTATASDAVIALVAKHKGDVAGKIDVRSEYRRQRLSNDKITLTIEQTVAGTGSPSTEAAISSLADDAFDWICFPYNDRQNLMLIAQELSDTAGRWGALQMLYGHVFTAKQATPGGLSTLGDSLNDQHLSVLGLYNSPTADYEIAAALTGKAWLHLSTAPELSRPLQTIVLEGVLAPEVEDVFTKMVRQAIYYDGIGSVTVGRDGKVRIDRLLTTYKLNGHGAPDSSYLDVQTLAQLQYVIRFWDGRIKQRYGRHALRDDDQQIYPGQYVVRPRDIKVELIAASDELSRLHVIENVEELAERLIVERSELDASALDIVIEPDLVNQFRIAKVLVQFYNEYPNR